jgi:nicotinamidase-related amidase
VKYNFNIFSNPNLVTRLSLKKTKTLILTGMDIIFCVETAVRNAFDLGYKVVVPEDAIAGNAKYPEFNNNAIEMFKRFGVVVKTSDILNAWKS